ncbi:MAG: glycosyltransferase family 39 protein [Acidobacteria bacterium]|nr:glycosyltransferase family 39 protein [Acidobacteriota bacterium]
MKRWLPVIVCLLHLCALTYLARQHPFGNYATETDFYHYYAPDAERIAAGQFPQNKFQGPGYPAVIALLGKLTGVADLFAVAKWLSVVCAVLCGWLVFVLFNRLFGFWVGVGAQLIAIVSGEFPQFSINAATDVFFLLVCLTVLATFTAERLSARWRIVLTGALTGAAYVVRYNGLFLLASCLLGIVLLNLFEQRWRERIKSAALFVGMFLLAASPWLVANYKHRGSPLYNANYLNIATEFYPELVKGEVNQDATRALETKFQSFGDVLRYDPARLLKLYPVNLYESLRQSVTGNLVAQLVGWLALLGIGLSLIGRRSKSLLLVLIAGGLYWLLMGLNHWETRYYFFVMVLYAGFAVFAAERWLELARAQGWLKASAFAGIPVALVVVMVAASLSASRKDVNEFLEAQPLEVAGARDFVLGLNASPNSLRIVARKPHLAYMSRQEWVFFPQVKSLEELRVWLQTNRVDYIAIGKREIKERKELKTLGDPKKAPDWLQPVWRYEPTGLILYQPK